MTCDFDVHKQAAAVLIDRLIASYSQRPIVSEHVHCISSGDMRTHAMHCTVMSMIHEMTRTCDKHSPCTYIHTEVFAVHALVGSCAGLAPTPRLTNIVQTTAWGEVDPICAAVHVSVRPPE